MTDGWEILRLRLRMTNRFGLRRRAGGLRRTVSGRFVNRPCGEAGSYEPVGTALPFRTDDRWVGDSSLTLFVQNDNYPRICHSEK